MSRRPVGQRYDRGPIRVAATIAALDSRIDDTSPPIAHNPDDPIATSARKAVFRPILIRSRAR